MTVMPRLNVGVPKGQVIERIRWGKRSPDVRLYGDPRACDLRGQPKIAGDLKTKGQQAERFRG